MRCPSYSPSTFPVHTRLIIRVNCASLVQRHEEDDALLLEWWSSSTSLWLDIFVRSTSSRLSFRSSEMPRDRGEMVLGETCLRLAPPARISSSSGERGGERGSGERDSEGSLSYELKFGLGGSPSESPSDLAQDATVLGVCTAQRPYAGADALRINGGITRRLA